MMLKRTPSLTEQAKITIKQRILNDEFDGGRIPSETELAAELGVSRTTIRDALSRLELEGAIYRKQGAGTFVNMPSLQLKTRLEEIWAYEAMLKAHGYTPSTRIISIETGLADPQTASDLSLPATANILTVRKLFLADGQPVILTLNEIPIDMIGKGYSQEIFHEPIFRFLADHCRQHLSYYLSEIVPLIASPQLVEVLKLKPQTALISFEEIGYNQNNEPILKAKSYFKDDLLRLRLIRREA